MKVLVITGLFPPNHIGGYEIACASFVDHLVNQGYQVRVLAARHPVTSPRASAVDIHRELEWYRTDDLSFRSPSVPARFRLERHNLATLRRHLSSFAPDVVNWWAMGGMSISLIESVRRAGIPAIGMVSDEWMVYGTAIDAWLRTFRRLPRLAGKLARPLGIPTTVEFGTAATWSFVSDYLRQTILEAGYSLPSSTIGRTGINADGLAPGSDDGEFGDTLLYLGRVTKVKGVDVAVRALGELPASYRLRIVGPADSAYERELTRLAADLGVSERVSLEPALDRVDLAECYRSAAAVLFPVRWNEPWGLVPLEAMACGTPVIATGTGGSAEYLEHERNCLLVSLNDHQAVAQSVERLAGDSELRDALRRHGLRSAARYSESECNTVFESQLREVAVAA
jgi:glycosyltransferase involved in cell wall biosynthesis